jgi:hypothetical protein
VGAAASEALDPVWEKKRIRLTGRGLLWTRRAWPPPGGQRTGPIPTGKGNVGSKRHIVVVDGEVVDAIEPIRKPRDRPRKRLKEASLVAGRRSGRGA